MTRWRLFQETDSNDIAEWMAFEQIDGPIGDLRADYRAALGAWAAVSPHVKEGQEISIDDYMLNFGEQEEEEGQLPEDEMKNREALLLAKFKVAVGDLGTWQ